MALSIIFATYTGNGFKKLHCERTFILYKTSLILKKDKCLRLLTGKKHPKIKLQALTKNTNIDIWAVGTSN